MYYNILSRIRSSNLVGYGEKSTVLEDFFHSHNLFINIVYYAPQMIQFQINYELLEVIWDLKL